jgi:hypothetical protein
MKLKFYLLLSGILFLQTYSIAQAPTLPSSNITFNNIEGNLLGYQWTPGNGARRMVVARQGSPVTAVPVNGIDYNANSLFGSGEVIAPDEFVVYDNAGSFGTIAGLQPNTIYHFAIFEYNGTGASTQYLTSSFAVVNRSTAVTPTVQTSGITVSNITGNRMTLSWTNGNGGSRIVVARAGSAVNASPVNLIFYNGSTSFGTGTQIGTGNYAVYSSTGNSFTITNLQPNTTYHFSVCEYNGSGGPVYLIPGATASATTLQRPTIAASNIIFGFTEGNSMNISWTNGNGSRRIVVARAGSAVTAVPVDGVDYNDGANSFGSGDEIQLGQFVVYDGAGFITANIFNLQPGTTYHYRVYEYDGTGAAIAYLTTSFAAASQATLSAPTTQATAVNFTNLTGNSVQVNWTNGNGNSRIVVARAGSAVNANPVNLNFYNGTASFGSGTQIGTGNYVVYSSSGSFVDITNLQINTTYHFAVYEYNGSSGPVYLVPGAIGNITTLSQPTVPASAIGFSSIEGNSYFISWTNGNGARRIVVARAGSPVTAVPVDGVDYNANAAFGGGDAIAPNEFVVYDNTSTFVSVTNLQPSTTYHFRIYEYNGSGATTSYLTSSFATGNQATVSAPTIQTSAINFTNIAGSTARINWTNGNGAGGRLVVLRLGSAVNANPVNLSFYNDNSTFGSGSQLGTGNFAVYNGFGTFVVVTNLLPNTTYHTAVYEYNGNSGRVYLVPGATASFTTAPQPTVPASNMLFGNMEGNSLTVLWSSGNGARRIVVARAGSPVTAVPVNGFDYNANPAFGNGDAIAPNEFVVYDNTSTFVGLTNLQPSTTYHFAIFEYDGSGTNTAYLTGSFLAGSQQTLSTPTLQASNVGFSALTGTSVTVGWTNGNGANRLVLMRQAGAVNVNPINFQSYNASSTFGFGTQIGTGNYTVYSSSGTSANVTGLISGTTYHIAVYEYNGNSGRIYLVPGAAASFTTLGPPQIQATAVSAASITAATLQLNWINGSGTNRLVIMRQGSAVNVIPVDNVNYTANTVFTGGSELGTGNYVVYNGTGNSVTVTTLNPNTTYHFAVFEFNDFNPSVQFLTINPARGNAATSGPLPVTFIDFAGQVNGNNVLLQWSTAQESNSSHFEIQRTAHDNTTNFIAIDVVTAAGESNTRKDYSYTDRFPAKGVNYYRIKQFDKDNRFMFSEIISIKYKPEGLIKAILNPVQNTLFVELTDFNPNIPVLNEWRLYDVHGRIVVREKITTNIIYGQLPILPAGMYILELQVGDKRERIKMIKQ